MTAGSHPVLLGPPGSAEERAQVAALVRLAMVAPAVLGLAVAVIVAVAPARSRPAGYHSAAIAAVSAAVLVLAAIAGRWRAVFSPTALVPILVGAAAVAGVVASLAGPQFGPLVTMYFVWYGTAVAFLSRRAAVALMAWALLVDAVMLATQPGRAVPVVRWEIVAGIMVFVAVGTNRLVERAWTLARGEQTARAEAERARAEVEVRSDEKTAFLARMSHELRTPLNAIIGFSEMLARRSFGALNTKQAEYVCDVVDSGRHLLSLVDDLLDLGKVEAGGVDLDLAPVDVAELLAASLALFKEQAARRRVTLRLEVAPGIGTIEADARKLRQVVFNLAANAVRFTPAGGRVTVGAQRTGDRIRLWVADTGPGIAAAEQQAIFDEFRQGAPASDAGRGTGLGLSVARRLVEAHGGALGLVSTPGVGSRFTVGVPVRQGRVPASALASPPSPTADAAGRAGPGRDDSPAGRRETARLLRTVLGVLLPLAAVIFATLRLSPPPPSIRYSQWPLPAAAGVCLAIVVALQLWPERTGTRAGVATIAVIGTVTMSGVMLGLYVPGLVGDVGVMYVLVMVVAGGFLVLTARQAAGLLGLIGVCYAAVLHQGDGYNLPVARWLADVGFAAVTGLILRHFVTRIEALTRAERDARRQAEAAAAALVAASRHKSEFLANMSHELRTPLNVIIGFSEVLASQVFGPLNEKQAEYVADVLAAGRHLLGLINDILDLAKLDAGRMELRRHDVDVEAFLDTVLTPFRGEAARRSVAVHVEIAARLDVIPADEPKLAQALGELVSNALRFSPDGSRATIRVGFDGDHVAFSVVDAGPGIDPSDHERIFDAFGYGGGSASAGSGLGLALARRYAALHGGSLVVQSTPGAGATFILRLPLEPEAATARRAEALA